MFLFAGLGNPGSQYNNSRHNLGFTIADKISEQYYCSKWKNKFKGLISEGIIDNKKVLILKPTTFMNESGISIKEAVNFYKVSKDQLFVIYDDIELAPGKIRVRFGGSHAGHNGVKNITNHIGPKFWRIKIGIGHPKQIQKVSSYVLGDFSSEDNKWLDDLKFLVSDHIPLILSGDNNHFMSAVAEKMNKIKPPPSNKNFE